MAHSSMFSPRSQRTLPYASDEHVTIAHFTPQSEASVKALNRVSIRKRGHASGLVSTPCPHHDKSTLSPPVWAYRITTAHLVTPEDGTWVLGRGTSNKPSSEQEVQLLLSAAGDRKAKDHLDEIHGKFFLHKDSGVWMFRNASQNHDVVYLSGAFGFSDLCLTPNDTVVLWQRTNRFRFGPYVFAFEFAADDTYDLSTYLNFRDAFLKAVNPKTSNSRYLDPLPKVTHKLAHDYILHGQVIEARGSSCVNILAGVDRLNGHAVAVKYYDRGRESQFSTYTRVIEKFADEPVGILPQLGWWQECGNFGTYVATPMAVSDFGRFDFGGIPWLVRLRLFQQTLQGLTTFHERGFVHRAIKPGHLLVLSDDPKSPSAAICDFGLAVKRGETLPKPDVAPHAVVAPEAWSDGFVTAESDVWGLAISWVMAIAGHDNPVISEGAITRSQHSEILTFVESVVGSAEVGSGHDVAGTMIGPRFAKLLSSMLAWDPADRLSAAEALQSDIWVEVAIPVSETVPLPSVVEGQELESGRDDEPEMDDALTEMGISIAESSVLASGTPVALPRPTRRPRPQGPSRAASPRKSRRTARTATPGAGTPRLQFTSLADAMSLISERPPSVGGLRSETDGLSVADEDMDPEGAGISQGAAGMLVMFSTGDQPRRRFYVR